VQQYRDVAATIERLSRLYASEVLWEMVYGEAITLEQLSDEAVVTAFAESLSERLQTSTAKGSSYRVVVRKDQERQLFFPVVKHLAHAVLPGGEALGPRRGIRD
jgi:DNA gyrase subunit B